MGNPPLKTKSSRTKLEKAIRKLSPRSVMKPSSGLMLTSWLKLMSSKINKKRSKEFAIQSSLSYTNKPVELLVACLEVCQVVCLEACLVVHLEELVPELPVVLVDQPLKKLIKH